MARGTLQSSRLDQRRRGTELTVRIDREKSELSALDRDLTAAAEITLVGNLELDGRAVECRVKLNLGTREGTGRLIPLTSVGQ